MFHEILVCYRNMQIINLEHDYLKYHFVFFYATLYFLDSTPECLFEKIAILT